MAWTDDQWNAFLSLLRRGWPGDFSAADGAAYRVLLDDTEPADAIAALKRLLYGGHRFRPSAAELLGSAHRDPSIPTFAEAFRLIYGSRGVIKARPAIRVFNDAGERDRAYRDAMLARADTMHPLVASFVRTHDPVALRDMPVDDRDWGRKTTADLERSWNAHVDRQAERGAAALASGRRGELARLDPLAALGMAGRREITEGDAA